MGKSTTGTENRKTAPKALGNAELSTFCGQLGMVLASGMSALEGVSIMAEDSPTPQGQALLRRILDVLELGGSLSEGLTETGAFPEYARKMVKAGERAGRLEDVLMRLGRYYADQKTIGRALRPAG